MRPPSRLCIDPLKNYYKKNFEKKTRTYETSQSCDRVHLGHLKKKTFEKKQGRMKRLKAATVFIWDIWKKKFWKKNSKAENQNISYDRAS